MLAKLDAAVHNTGVRLGVIAMTYPFNSNDHSERMTRVAIGMTAPLWLPFLFAAGVGVAAWTVSRRVRGDLAAMMPGAPAWRGATPASPAPAETAQAAFEAPPAVEDTAPTAADLMAVGAIDAALPDEPAVGETAAAADADEVGEVSTSTQADESVAAVAEEPAPLIETAPVVPDADDAGAAAIATEVAPDAAPVESGSTGAKLPERVSDFELGEEPGGKAGLLAETSASALSATIGLGADVRAEEAAEASPPAGEDTSADDMSTLADAAYAENFGPVPTPAKKSRKRKVPPGVAPDA